MSTDTMISARRRTRKVAGIWCVEGEWSDRPSDERSVRPFLQILEEWPEAPVAYARARTPDEMRLNLRRWGLKQSANYRVLYFASHGEPGSICLGGGDVTLEELGESLAGRCAGRAVYFGSCATLRVPQARIDQFRRTTGAAAVIGYTKTADWIPSAALDMVQLAAIASHQRWSTIDRRASEDYPGPVRDLGFTVHHGR